MKLYPPSPECWVDWKLICVNPSRYPKSTLSPLRFLFFSLPWKTGVSSCSGRDCAILTVTARWLKPPAYIYLFCEPARKNCIMTERKTAKRTASKCCKQRLTNWLINFSATWWQPSGGMTSGFMKDSQVFSNSISLNRSFGLMNINSMVGFFWRYNFFGGRYLCRLDRISTFIRNMLG